MSVNVEKIISDIKAEIKEKGYTSNILRFEDVVSVSKISIGVSNKFDVKEYSEIVAYLDAYSAVAVNIPQNDNFLKVFIKKVIRKLIIRPIARHQSDYNVYTARAFSLLKSYVESLPSPEILTELANKSELLELQIRNASKEIERLNRKLLELEARK